MKRGLRKGVNGEQSSDSAWKDIEVTTEREAIVKKLNGMCNQLLRWGLSHNPGNVSRCQFFRAAIYATSIQLQALKDKELDDLRKDVEEIKEKQKELEKHNSPA